MLIFMVKLNPIFLKKLTSMVYQVKKKRLHYNMLFGMIISFFISSQIAQGA